MMNSTSMSLDRKPPVGVRGGSSISFNCLTAGGTEGTTGDRRRGDYTAGSSEDEYVLKKSAGISRVGWDYKNNNKVNKTGTSAGGLGSSVWSLIANGGSKKTAVTAEKSSGTAAQVLDRKTKFVTVREVKKRSKNSKSRTLPGRLKKKSGCHNVDQETGNPALLTPNNNLSIFKVSDSDEPWCLDVDSFGSYVLEGVMPGPRKTAPSVSSGSSTSGSSSGFVSDSGGGRSQIGKMANNNNSKNFGGSTSNLAGSRARSLSKLSLARMVGRGRNGSGDNNNSSSSNGKPANSNLLNLGGSQYNLNGGTDRSRSRSRSRSRLSNSVFSVSQCFGLSPGPGDSSWASKKVTDDDNDDEDMDEWYGSRMPKRNLPANDDGDLSSSDCYCPSTSTAAATSIVVSTTEDDGRGRMRVKKKSLAGGEESKSLSWRKRKLRNVNGASSSIEFLDRLGLQDEEMYASDTSYDKACGNDQQRRSSAPLTPLLGGRETPSRFANFFSKRSFKSNPLKRTKSVTKLERKKPIGLEPESNNMLYPSRLRTSRSHESLLAWTTNPHAVNSVVNAGMMTTVDLTAGDVGVRPLHPSILGQHYAFQVITPSGSKYMSCSSAAERNAWVHAIRQAIKPHQDEMRRQENSLKIWILEAKGVSGGASGKSSSKRYFCELYLDDVLYARTCGKQRGEMLFWGEHFEFTQLANVQLITVVFFREGDKKRKKERNTCIGKVKIPVNTVNSRSLIEKWYPVVADAGSNGSSSSHTTLTSNASNSKDKDGPSLRIKCKFQSVDILPLRCYKTFLQYVKDEFGPVCESLENVLSVKAKEELANAMVHVLHHEGLAKEFIAELALQEILKSGDEKLTFRGNSIATKAMEAFLKLVGSEYLHATLGPFIEQFQNAEDVHDCEIDPMKLPQTSSGTLRKNQEHLRTAVDIVWKSILHSHNGMFPIELRDCFVHCREALKSAGKEELSDHLISASIFLRFFCPAILSPSLFNITNEYPSEKSARNLTLVAKVLQTLANFTRFQGKESYMEFINDFVEKEAPNMKAFLLQISSPLTAEAAKKLHVENQGKVPAGGFIDLGKYLSMLSTLLAESVPKIAPKNDRFKQLQDIVEHIHWLVKQPGNVTSASPFPFPHVASPPPNVPPPPAPTVGLNLNLPGGNGHGQHRLASSAATSPTNPVALNHQYQIPHQNINGGNVSGSKCPPPQPIYAVSGGVIHNTQNPNVKNISQIHPIPHHPLQLQIPNVATPSGNINGGRSGSQASSGYQSQSPVLEGSDDKSKKNSAPTDHYINIQRGSHGLLRGSAAVMEESIRNSPNRKCNSQSVDDLSSLAIDNSGFKKRLTRSSSSSDCDCQPEYLPNKSSKARNGQHKIYSPSNSSAVGGAKVGSKKIVATPHHRLNRRSSAELLKKNHPYSTSTDEDSDSFCLNVSERSDVSGGAPVLPPRRVYAKRNSGVGPRPNPDGGAVAGSNDEKSLDEVRRLNMRTNSASKVSSLDAKIECTKYEREMIELRRAMEALQMKLNRAEERLFGHDSPTAQVRREPEVFYSNGSPASLNNNSNGVIHSGAPRERLSLKAGDEESLEMDHLLQRLQSAEEEMRREQDLLTALDRKQKLIEVQEQKIARLDAVNNQLLDALAQIRDSLQQQQVQAQQQKVQMQLHKQQQQLQSLTAPHQANRNTPSSNLNIQQQHYVVPGPQHHATGYPPDVVFDYIGSHHQKPLGPPPPVARRTKGNNTTKVMITSDSSSENSSPLMSLDDTSYSSNSPEDCCNNGNRDSSTFLAENALKMLAELKSSSC